MHRAGQSHRPGRRDHRCRRGPGRGLLMAFIKEKVVVVARRRDEADLAQVADWMQAANWRAPSTVLTALMPRRCVLYEP